MFHGMFHAINGIPLESLRRAQILRCSKEMTMGIIEIIAGAFLVSVPAFILTDGLEKTDTDAGE